MKKRSLILAVIFTLVLVLPAYAVEQRTVGISPSLSFDGTNAICKVQILGNTSSDSISVTIKLWQGSICLKAWDEEGTGILLFEDTVGVTKGKTYKLTADAVINGKPQSTVFIENTFS